MWFGRCLLFCADPGFFLFGDCFSEIYRVGTGEYLTGIFVAAILKGVLKPKAPSKVAFARNNTWFSYDFRGDGIRFGK